MSITKVESCLQTIHQVSTIKVKVIKIQCVFNDFIYLFFLKENIEII